MAVDNAALAAHIDTEARYDEAVRTGNNGAIAKLINDTRTDAGMVWDDMPVDDFLAAIASESLTAVKLAWVQTYTSGRGNILTSSANVQTWIADNLSAGVATAIKDQCERKMTWAQAAGACGAGEKISVSDVRKAVKSVTKSFINVRGTHPNAADVTSEQQDAIRAALAERGVA
jgi:hypothetical protein